MTNITASNIPFDINECEKLVTYSHGYPDGSAMKTELCTKHGHISFFVRFPGMPDYMEIILDQVKAHEFAYAMLKSINRFNHFGEFGEAMQDAT